MPAPRKNRLSFVERMQSYAEQSRARKEPKPAPAKPQQPPRSCRIHFWQQIEGGPILIGYTTLYDNRLLKSMRGEGSDRAHSLAVIPYANTARFALIQERFAHLNAEAGKPIFRAEPELLDFIATHAEPWEIPVRSRSTSKEPDTSKEPKQTKFVDRICESCHLPYRTSKGYRFCSKCQKAVVNSLYAEGYLQSVPRKTYINPDNYGASRDGDPSPWGENAVKALEDGD